MSRACWIHLASAIFWIPFALFVFAVGWENSVFLIFLLSVYANFKTDWGAFHAARSEDSD
jgi:hypothetical protein